MPRVVLLALAVGIAAAVQSDAVSVTGAWTVSQNIAGNASEQSCTFTQKDADVTGSCAGAQGPLTVKGKVEGKNVRWQYETQWEGQPLTIVYTGTVQSSEKIAGSVDVQPMGVSGEFTATLSKTK